MTITLATADALDALALTIFDPHITQNPNPVLGNKWGPATGLDGPDPDVDAQYFALIAEPMLIIDGRTMAPGFRYTLNVTNALQGRPRHWYANILELDGSGYGWPASCAMEYHPSPGTITDGVNSFGGAIGLATCACICRAWAVIIRAWLIGNYPLAVNQPV